MNSHTTINTTNASKYLQQLCKHWSHKNECTYDVDQGRVLFTSGNLLELAATGEQLTMHVTVAADGDLDGFKQVVDTHLLRFAFREELAIHWG